MLELKVREHEAWKLIIKCNEPETKGNLLPVFYKWCFND